MRRCLYVIALAIMLLSLFSVSVCAQGSEDYVNDFLHVIGRGEDFAENIGIDALIEQIGLALLEQGGRITAFFGFVIGATLLIALASLLTNDKHTAIGVSAIVAAGAVGFIFEVADSAARSLEQMSGLFLSLIPIMSGVTLAGGGVSSAGAEAVAMGGIFGTVSGLMTPIIFPLVSVMLALSAVSALGGGVSSAALSRVRAVFLWLLGIATVIMLGGISLQTVICASKDSMTMRMAKYSASGLLPIIGSTVSASLSSLAAGLSYAKGIIGAGGIYVFLLSALTPLLLALIYRAALSLASGFLSFLGASEGAATLGGIVYSLDALLSVYSISVILYVFELIMFMKSGVAIL